ncbi:HupE/UreJ family protein [Mesorhizobium sp. B2-4-14]|uniref:HupE/UreJ family protein n=1 Tax=Mesorhizobium sp. B2-4-14 TaxID=2589935 RepID=UPI001FF01A1A|nr:HupE/UreJ family protein [Mesorhizobium sp. B2-4-14]
MTPIIELNRTGGRTAMNRAILGACAAAIVFVPVAASAHPGVVGLTHGFASGWTHPFSGMDHILAMIAVGLFAAHMGGRARWLVPLTFVFVMTLAGIVGMAGVKLPFAEIGIAMSVIVLGLAVAFQLSVPTLVATFLVGFFAIFHGHAHGTEMPESMSGLTYGLGFICATALLHATGVGLGIAIGRTGPATGRQLAQVAGAAISFAGIALLILP